MRLPRVTVTMSGAPLSDNVPLVIGGHHDSIAGLPQALPPAVRKDFARELHC